MPAGSKPSVVAVVAAGGAGSRMNSAVPKQFLKLAGKAVLLRTVGLAVRGPA